MYIFVVHYHYSCYRYCYYYYYHHHHHHHHQYYVIKQPNKLPNQTNKQNIYVQRLELIPESGLQNRAVRQTAVHKIHQLTKKETQFDTKTSFFVFPSS